MARIFQGFFAVRKIFILLNQNILPHAVLLFKLCQNLQCMRLILLPSRQMEPTEKQLIPLNSPTTNSSCIAVGWECSVSITTYPFLSFYHIALDKPPFNLKGIKNCFNNLTFVNDVPCSSCSRRAKPEQCCCQTCHKIHKLRN